MQPLSPTLRWVLTLVSAGIAVLAGPDVFSILPFWAQVVISVVSAVVLAALLPPNWQPNPERTRAFKRGTPTRAADHKPVSKIAGAPPAKPRQRRSVSEARRRPRLGWGLALGLIVAAFAAAATPTTASAYLHRANVMNACAGAIGNNMPVYGASDFYRYSSTDLAVRIVFPNDGYSSWNFADCRYVGNDNTATGGVIASYQFAVWAWTSVPWGPYYAYWNHASPATAGYPVWCNPPGTGC